MWYKQEGELVPFTAWPWMRTITLLSPQFKLDFKQLYGYFNKDYGWFYWDLQAMNELAKWTYETYGNSIEKIYFLFTQAARSLEELYLSTYDEKWQNLTIKDLLEKYSVIGVTHTKMWSTSLFIDSFDPGFDQEQIEKKTKEFSLTKEEATVLATPDGITYASERRLDFLQIILKFDAKLSVQHPEIKEHIKRYDYYQYSYAHPQRITVNQIEEEIKTAQKNIPNIKDEFTRLNSFQKEQQNKINEILKKHSLSQNPFYFFQTLTYWREHRKKVNMMGCYMLHRFLEVLELKSRIPKRFLEYLNYDEVKGLFSGKINKEILKKRYQETTLLRIQRRNYTLYSGLEAKERRKELESQMLKNGDNQIRGTTACWGKVQGRVKVIRDRNDFVKFQQGDILVAGMTRPEHVPLLKKAAAIVTNEGGITCHAAIVSRELNIPCIIGTKVATEVLKDGDLVEVNAN